MKLAKFPRLRITHGPTPLEPMHRLTAALGGPNLWIKRDDCTGLATGGNKTRKLEYLVARPKTKIDLEAGFAPVTFHGKK